jgi:hypothetical protein
MLAFYRRISVTQARDNASQEDVRYRLVKRQKRRPHGHQDMTNVWMKQISGINNGMKG